MDDVVFQKTQTVSADDISRVMTEDRTDTTTVICRAIRLNFDIVAIVLIIIATFILSWAFWTVDVASFTGIFTSLLKGLIGFASLWVTVALKVRTPPGRFARKKIQQLQKPPEKLNEWGRTVIK